MKNISLLGNILVHSSLICLEECSFQQKVNPSIFGYGVPRDLIGLLNRHMDLRSLHPFRTERVREWNCTEKSNPILPSPLLALHTYPLPPSCRRAPFSANSSTWRPINHSESSLFPDLKKSPSKFQGLICHPSATTLISAALVATREGLLQ